MPALQDIQTIHQVLEISVEVEELDKGTNLVRVILEQLDAGLILHDDFFEDLLDPHHVDFEVLHVLVLVLKGQLQRVDKLYFVL